MNIKPNKPLNTGIISYKQIDGAISEHDIVFIANEGLRTIEKKRVYTTSYSEGFAGDRFFEVYITFISELDNGETELEISTISSFSPRMFDTKKENATRLFLLYEKAYKQFLSILFDHTTGTSSFLRQHAARPNFSKLRVQIETFLDSSNNRR